MNFQTSINDHPLNIDLKTIVDNLDHEFMLQTHITLMEAER